MSDTIIRLDVGGVHYNTTRSTLCRVAGSMLERMFNGSIPSKKVKGRYFIDRDGLLFQYILRYLRDTDVWTPPSDVDVCRDLLREARFFCLDSLVVILETAINTNSTVHQPSVKQAFAVRVESDSDNIYFYVDTPSELMKKFISWKVNGRSVDTCHELIKRAMDLGYSLTSSVYIQEHISTVNEWNKKIDYSIMLTFESK
jgi:hypothetical protein